ERADTPRSAAHTAHYAGIDDPAIEEGRDGGEKFLRPMDQPAIKLVDIKKPSQKIDLDRLARPVSVKCNRQSRPEHHRRDRQHGDDKEEFFLMRNREEMSREKSIAAEPRQERKHNKGSGHDQRRFVARASGVAAWLREKHNHHQSQDVERGQKCREERDDKDRHVAIVSERKNRIFAKEPAE